MSRGARRATLLCVLAGAAALRFWALAQGLPHPSARPDEREVLLHTLGFSNGDWNPHWFIYPNLYLYLSWAWSEVLLSVRRLFVATPNYPTAYATDLPLLLLTGRTLSAAAGTATVALVYGVGRWLGGSRVGLVAAALLAANLLHVRDSHALKPDALVTLGVVVSLFLLARAREVPGLGRAAAAGLAIGLTTAIKYNGVLLLVAPWVADVLDSPATGWRRLVPTRALVVIGAVAAASFLLSGPYFAIDIARTRDTFLFSMWAEYSTRPAARPDASVGWIAAALTWVRTRAFAYHLAVSLRRGCGLTVALAAPFAIAHGLRAPRRPFLLLSTVFAAVHYLVVGASPVHLTRYFTPLVPLLLLAVAMLVDALAGRASRPATRAVLAGALALVLGAEPLAASVAQDRIAARTDTRILALDWMQDHVPHGAIVAVLGSPLFSYADPLLPPETTQLPPNVPAAEFARRGVSFVVTHWHHQLTTFSQPNPAMLAALAPHLRLLAEFSPYTGDPAGAFETEDAYYVPFFAFAGVARPGPLVRVYAYSP